MAANDNIPITSTGPALGNVPTPDSYLRLKLNIDGLKAQIAALQAAGSQSASFTAQQLQQLQKALQANGSNPLNLTALAGQTLQPQQGLIPSVLTLAASGTDGQLVFYRNAVWRFSASTHKWTPITSTILLDYEYNLGSYNPSKYAPGTIFISISTGVSFIEEDTSTGSQWVPLYSETVAYPHVDRYSAGTATSTAANSVYTIVPTSGPGFLPEMVGGQIWFNNAIYPISSYNNGSLLLGANAGNQNNQNYVFEFPSINYPRGALFYETDRTVLYVASDANGNVSVAGNNITKLSGIPFDVYWTQMSINGNDFSVSVANNTSAVLQGNNSPGNGNFNYSVSRGAWFYATGIMIAANNAVYPTDLDISTNHNFSMWDDSLSTFLSARANNAGALQWLPLWAAAISDLHSNRNQHPPTSYPDGALYFETDRTVFYRLADASGLASVAGNILTNAGGVPFDPSWAGYEIVLGGNFYPVLSVSNTSSAVIGNPPLNGNYTFTMPRGAWFYTIGFMNCAGNGAFPSDLNIYQDLGFRVWDSNWTVMREATALNNNVVFTYRWGTYYGNIADIPAVGTLHDRDTGLLFAALDVDHQFRYGGSNNGWAFAPGDPGSGYIVAGTKVPNGGLWALCDGNNANVTQANGNVTLVATPNLTAGVFLRGGNNGSNSIGVVNPATSPTWLAGSATDPESNHTHVIPDQNTGLESAHTHTISFITGTANLTAGNNLYVQALNNTTSNGSPHLHDVPSQSTNNGSPHNHTLSNSAAVLNPPSNNNGGLPLNVALLWYMRR